MSSLTGQLIAGWVRRVEQHAILSLTVLVFLTVAAGLYSAMYARVNSDLSELIKPSDDTQWYLDNEEYKQAFPDSQQTAVVAVFGGNYLAVNATAKALSQSLRETGDFLFVRAPGLEPFLMDHRLYFLTTAELNSWLQGVQFNYGTLLRLAEDPRLANLVLILSDQLSAYPGMPLPPVLNVLLDSFVAGDPRVEAYPRLIPPQASDEDDGYVQLIVLKGIQALDESLPNEAIVARIRSVISGLPVAPGVNIRLTGEVVLAHEEISAGLEGVGLAGMVSLVLLAIILGFGVRSWKIIVAAFCLLLAGIVLTSAYATLVVGSYNTLSLVFLVMFFGLGIDFAVHFALKISDETRFNGSQGAATRAAGNIGPALLLCTLTSAVGFLSFVPTAYNGLGELGIISAGGMAIAFFLSVTMLPAMFKLMGGIDGNTGVRIKLLTFGVKPKIVLMLFSALVVLSLLLVRDMKFDYSVLALRDIESEGMSTLLELQRRKIVTDYSVAVLANDEAELKLLEQQIKALPTVGDVFSVENVVPTQQDNKQLLLKPVLALINSIELEEPVDDGIDLAGALQYFFESRQGERFPQSPQVQQFIERASRDENSVAMAKNPINVTGNIRSQLVTELAALKAMLLAEPFGADELPESILDTLVTADGRRLITVQPAVPLLDRHATDEFIADVTRVSPKIAGRSVVEWGVGNVVVESFLEAVIYAGSGIFFLLVVYFRSLLLPLLVVFPLTLTVLFTFAIAELSGLTLNMANILVVPLIFGLGVDTGIHVMHRFSASASLEEALASSTSRAVVISGLTTIGTFASLALSPHKGAASIGILLTIAITILLITTFVALPALLSVLPRSGDKSAAGGRG